MYAKYSAYEEAVYKSAAELQKKFDLHVRSKSVSPDIVRAAIEATTWLKTLKAQEEILRKTMKGRIRPDVQNAFLRRAENSLKADFLLLAEGRGAKQFGSPIFTWLAKPGAIDAAAAMINDNKFGVAAFREKVRSAVFESTVDMSKEFAARVVKAANNRISGNSKGNLHGALLEVLTFDVAKAEAIVLNKLRAAADAGDVASKTAYLKMLDEIFVGQDAAMIQAAIGNRRFTWIAGTSGTQFQDDVRLAAVAVDQNGNVLKHRLDNDPGKTGEWVFDHALVSKVYECKSLEDGTLSFAETKVMKAAHETLVRAIQELVDHQLEAPVPEIVFTISDIGESKWKGITMPRPLENIITSIETLRCAVEKIDKNKPLAQQIPATLDIKRSGGGDVFARIILRDGRFFQAPSSFRARMNGMRPLDTKGEPESLYHAA